MSGSLFRRSAGFETVHDRHFQVEEDERRPFGRYVVQGLLAIASKLHLVAPRLEEIAHHDPVIELVVYNQDSFFGHLSDSLSQLCKAATASTTVEPVAPPPSAWLPSPADFRGTVKVKVDPAPCSL